MPRENKKRGKRGDKKRKLGDTAPGDQGDSAKRMRLHDETSEGASSGSDNEMPLDEYREDPRPGPDAAQDDAYAGAEADRPFYGMLDEDENDYFKKADEMLEANSFGDAEERALFLENVFKEADGKELKMACSQSCSRLMERLINSATPVQLSNIFQKLNGHFVHLVQHRFASHCCEMLFTKAAPLVTDELLHKSDQMQTTGSDAVYVPMEQLFLHTVAELEGDIGFLMTDRFASHTLRLLLLVLAGESLDSQSNKHLLSSKKKEGVTKVDAGDKPDGAHGATRSVPKSFTDALENLMSKSVAGLNTQGLRALALHPLGSPILQLLIRLELVHFGKTKAKDEASIFRTLVPEEVVAQGTESAGFINGLNYDPIGSHLLEVIIEYTPGKMFKHLYKEFWKDRMASLSRNDIAAFVVCKILERISRDDLIEAHELIVPVIPDLIEKGRIVVIKTLMQRCAVRNVDTQAVAVAIDRHFSGPEGFDIFRLLGLDKKQFEERSAQRRRIKKAREAAAEQENGPRGPLDTPEIVPTDSLTLGKPGPAVVQGSVLAQAMVLMPGPLSGLIFDSIPTVPANLLFEMACDPSVSRTIQATMTSTNASIIPRRKFVQQFYGHIGEMALDNAASHVVDAIWEGTHGLAFIRERIAEELAENERSLRNSPCGRAVWKNWKMDLYKRRRQEWVLQSRNKASNDGFQAFEELDKNKARLLEKTAAAGSSSRAPKTGMAAVLTAALQGVVDEEKRNKTPLEKARERHAANKKNAREHEARSKRGNGGGGSGGGPSSGGLATGANATSVV